MAYSATYDITVRAPQAKVFDYVADVSRHGEWSSRILAVGTTESVRQLLTITRRASASGLNIVGACVEDAELGSTIDGIPVVGGVLGVAQTAARIDVDIVAIAGEGVGTSSIRELGWALEDSGRGLIISPALTTSKPLPRSASVRMTERFEFAFIAKQTRWSSGTSARSSFWK